MTYKHLIIIASEDSRDSETILGILNKHTNFGKWEFTVRPHPMMDYDYWYFTLNNEVNFASYEIVGIIEDLTKYLQFEPWHIALNNVGDYEIQP